MPLPRKLRRVSGYAVNTSVLVQELAPLNAQVEQVRGTLTELESEMRVAEAELETFSADRLRFDALRDACNALYRLDELEAGQLFWGEVPEFKDVAGHIERLQSRIARFDGEIRGVQEKQANLKTQVNQRLDELDYLHDAIRNAHARDERRKDEFVVERELSPVPHHPSVMPWSDESESERRYRRTLLIAMFFSMLLGGLIHLVTLPVPVRPVVVEIPERLVSMLRKERPKPEPPSERKEEKKPKKDQEKVPEKQEDRPKATTAETQAARKKAESTGFLAFKESFSDLIDETPVARLGAEARLSNTGQVAGQAVAQRSLVSIQTQSGGGSGGISNATVSRNVGTGNADRLGDGSGVANFARVTSAVAGLAAQESRPLSAGAGPARTDEEIQIVFDRYKAALYRIYNSELRKNPTLRGKMVLRITIEPGGEVSVCTVESSDLASPELVAQIVERVKKFNFGTKEKVPKTSILYPIDFLPAG